MVRNSPYPKHEFLNFDILLHIKTKLKLTFNNATYIKAYFSNIKFFNLCRVYSVCSVYELKQNAFYNKKKVKIIIKVYIGIQKYYYSPISIKTIIFFFLL